ncbi:MAG: hypothetical protein IIB46_06280 [Nitrospinae bacterium]|nr:hypothetical protein [Nitrospinota bacterium]
MDPAQKFSIPHPVAAFRAMSANLRSQLLNFIEEKHDEIVKAIEKEKKLDEDIEAKLTAAVKEYKGLFSS